VQKGEYRADLYYRINVVSIFLPPLRERRGDIPLLATHFLDRFNKENSRRLKLTPEAMKVLTSCYWPGNVRELENCIERTATMVQGDVIRDLSFPCKHNRCLTQTLHYLDKADAVAPVSLPVPAMPVREAAGRPVPPAHELPPQGGPGLPAGPAADAWFEGEEEGEGVTVIGPTENLPPSPARGVGSAPPQGERERLIWAMEQCGWVQAKAARLLKITPRQLGYALLKHRIEVRKF
jgi:Nif-specific regulatory protein